MEHFGFQWHITDRCTGKCKHCYQSNFNSAAELSIGRLKDIAAHIVSGFSTLDTEVSINLTGGEPLLYKDLFELMNFLSSFSEVSELNLITSSFGMDPSVIDELKKVTKLTSVKISLESHLPAVNNSIRGEGHFEMAAGNIRTLARVGMPVIIMVTLGSYNYNCVEGVCALAAELGAAGVIFERYVPLGRGEGLREQVLSSRQWRDVISAVCRLGDLDEDDDGLLAYKAFWIDTSCTAIGEQNSVYPVSGAFCNLGSSSMALMPDGTVFPCRRLPVPIGRLPDLSMEQLLEKLSKFSPHVLRKEMKDSVCGSCTVDGCSGCRALSLALGGGMYGDDPVCGLS